MVGLYDRGGGVVVVVLLLLVMVVSSLVADLLASFCLSLRLLGVQAARILILLLGLVDSPLLLLRLAVLILVWTCLFLLCVSVRVRQ